MRADYAMKPALQRYLETPSGQAQPSWIRTVLAGIDFGDLVPTEQTYASLASALLDGETNDAD